MKIIVLQRHSMMLKPLEAHRFYVSIEHRVVLHLLRNGWKLYLSAVELFIEQKMNYLDAELRKVLNGNYHRLEINHGIGEGILKKAVTDRLRQYGFEFHDFSYSNPGTTVVNLREEP